jgi:hypothetical protein
MPYDLPLELDTDLMVLDEEDGQYYHMTMNRGMYVLLWEELAFLHFNVGGLRGGVGGTRVEWRGCYYERNNPFSEPSACHAFRSLLLQVP